VPCPIFLDGTIDKFHSKDTPKNVRLELSVSL
jgi:hypothetical protein